MRESIALLPGISAWIEVGAKLEAERQAKFMAPFVEMAQRHQRMLDAIREACEPYAKAMAQIHALSQTMTRTYLQETAPKLPELKLNLGNLFDRLKSK